MDKEKG